MFKEENLKNCTAREDLEVLNNFKIPQTIVDSKEDSQYQCCCKSIKEFKTFLSYIERK